MISLVKIIEELSINLNLYIIHVAVNSFNRLFNLVTDASFVSLLCLLTAQRCQCESGFVLYEASVDM